MSDPAATRPFAPFEWMLSLRYLRARRKEGFISVIAGFSFLGIMLGVATLIIVMAVMNGFRKELLDKILGINGHLIVRPLEAPLTDCASHRAHRAFPASSWPCRSSTARRWPLGPFQAAQRRPSASGRARHRGPAKLARRSPATSSRARSTGSTTGERRGDRQAARRISRRCAPAALTLLAPRGDVTPMGTAPRIKTYKSTAVFEIGMSEYDFELVFMPLSEAQAYFNRAGDVTAIEVYVDEPDQVDQLSRPSSTQPRAADLA